MHDPNRATFWEHLEDLRKTLLGCMIIVGTTFIFSLFFYETLFSYFTPQFKTNPIRVCVEKTYHNQGQSAESFSVEGLGFTLQPGEKRRIEVPEISDRLVILSPLEGFTMMFKICFWVSLALSSPLWLYLILKFISPAFGTVRVICFFIISSLLFSGSGLLFGKHVTLPFATNYLDLFNAPLGVRLWSLQAYTEFSLLILICHAFAFELAAFLFMLIHFGAVSHRTLKSYRNQAYLCCFIIGAVLTPPDILTQVLLALPLCVLYECLQIYAKRIQKHSMEYLRV